MVALARKSLVFQWRRYLPASIAVALAGVLLFSQSALVLGIFATASAFVRASSADLWVGYPQTPSVDLGQSVTVAAEMRLRMDPQVARVDSLRWLDAAWRAPGSRKHIAVVIAGLNTAPDGLLFARVLTPRQREQLRDPGAVLVDPADVSKLGVAVGEYGYIGDRRVRLVGVAPGLRSLGAVTVATSAATARWLTPATSGSHGATYYLARLMPGADPQVVRRRLESSAGNSRYEAWTAQGFARRTTLFWLFDTGAGLGFICAAVLVFLVGSIIATQALAAAISGSLREFAMLRALGVTRTELASTIMAQASWLGMTGLVLATLVSTLVVAIAQMAHVPIAPSVSVAVLCIAGVMGVAWLSGFACMSRLSHTDPSTLLRA